MTYCFVGSVSPIDQRLEVLVVQTNRFFRVPTLLILLLQEVASARDALDASRRALLAQDGNAVPSRGIDAVCRLNENQDIVLAAKEQLEKLTDDGKTPHIVVMEMGSKCVSLPN